MKADTKLVEPGVYSVLVGGRSYEVRIDGEKATWRGRSFSTAPPDAPGARARNQTGPARISTTMPGKVIRVLVKAGDPVQAGQGIVVVEAMKMQNEMKAPRGGVVKTLRAAEGATVAAGEVIALIE